MRYIIIDHNSGYIYGDTADLRGPARSETPIQACQRLDESIGVYGREYEEHGPRYVPSGTAYHIYQADVFGAELIPVVTDGQDQATIDLVERECEPISVVVATDPAYRN